MACTLPEDMDRLLYKVTLAQKQNFFELVLSNPELLLERIDDNFDLYKWKPIADEWNAHEDGAWKCILEWRDVSKNVSYYC